jgi:hypothetical protein
MEPTTTSELVPDKDACRRLYRAVISDAVRDLGYGTELEARRVITWMHSDSFDHACGLAEYDERWISDLIDAVDAIKGDVRRPLVKQVLKGLRALARISGSASTPLIAGFVTDKFVIDEDMKYIAAPPSILSRASVAMHERRRADGDGD